MMHQGISLTGYLYQDQPYWNPHEPVENRELLVFSMNISNAPSERHGSLLLLLFLCCGSSSSSRNSIVVRLKMIRHRWLGSGHMENRNDFICKKNECCWYGYCLLVDQPGSSKRCQGVTVIEYGHC